MTVPNFSELGSKKMEEIERPKNPPVGDYIFVVSKLPKIEDDNKEWTFVTYPFKCLGATESVDQDALQEYGGFAGILQSRRFLFSKTDQAAFERTAYQHRQFLENHLKCWEAGMTQTEAMNNAVNKQCLGTISWAADKRDPEVMHANVNTTAPIE